MKNKQSELEFETQRLAETIALAQSKLEQAILENENNSAEITMMKKEMREDATHSVSSLYHSQNFEDLIELSQLVNPITERVADYEAVANKIAILEKLLDSPYFARIDFKFDDEDTVEKIYIGRSSLKKDVADVYVYDWRSPIASMFYRFSTGATYYDAPAGRITGELSLKRQYEIHKGTLEYFFDADVQIVDEFLRKMLSQNASAKMKTIVETIQKEQDIVIRDMENELMMVQGVAGSGKTSIALHRAAYLMYQGLSSKLSAQNIIIISPNEIFEHYISNVLPELGENNVASMVVDEMLAEILQNNRIQTRNQFFERLLISSGYRNIMKESIEFKTSQIFLEVLDRFIEDLPHRWVEFNDVYYGDRCIANKELLKEKLLSGRKEIPLGQRLKQIEEFIIESARECHKQYADRSEYDRIRNELRAFTELDIESLYKELFRNKDYLYGLAKEFELPDYLEDILKFTQENIYSKTLYYDDASALAYLKVRINGASEYKNIKQVVIDEAQDYYPLHYELFHLLFANAKYTILGDINQTLEKKEDLSLYEQIRKRLNKKKSSLVIMEKSFRCTNEILNFSSKFITQSVEIKSFNRDGDEPKVHVEADMRPLCDKIVAEAKHCLKKGYQSIGLICKTEKNARLLDECLSGIIDVLLIDDESVKDLQGVFIIPVYLSKGLEFDAVLICDVDQENYRNEDDKKLLYIACTRALHRLNLFCMGEASPLL